MPLVLLLALLVLLLRLGAFAAGHDTPGSVALQACESALRDRTATQPENSVAIGRVGTPARITTLASIDTSRASAYVLSGSYRSTESLWTFTCTVDSTTGVVGGLTLSVPGASSTH